jgi:hypothetical protein
MAFEFKKFLLENKLTTGSKLKSLNEEEEDAIQDEPTAKDLKAGSKSTADLAKKQNQLAVLLKHKNEILDQYKKGQITIEQYKDKIGNIPQHIKNLTTQIEKATIADDQIDEYEMGDESNKLASYELVGAIIDKLEDHLEGGEEYTESQLHDVIADYVYDNPMSDKAAEELFFDVEEKLYDLGYVKAS